jgi:hypothetical protein
MDTTKFDTVVRLFGSGMTRREALRSLVAGATAVAAGGTLLTSQETEARKRRRRNRCAGKNWCVDRTDTCGPSDGYGKCLETVAGKHICAEILFQVRSCDECEPPNCTDCKCVPAVGGADKCNNGANGYDFICVRKV